MVLEKSQGPNGLPLPGASPYGLSCELLQQGGQLVHESQLSRQGRQCSAPTDALKRHGDVDAAGGVAFWILQLSLCEGRLG